MHPEYEYLDSYGMQDNSRGQIHIELSSNTYISRVDDERRGWRAARMQPHFSAGAYDAISYGYFHFYAHINVGMISGQVVRCRGAELWSQSCEL